MKIKDVGELRLIRRIARGIKLDRSVVKGIGDDTAVIAWTRDTYLLYACDMLVENVHFTRRGAKPFQIGWKALARNVSDIAAMGGMPRYAVVAIGAPADLDVKVIDGLYSGIKALAKKFKINIVGGDMSRSAKLVIDISLIGEVRKKDLVLRSGAKPGDLIFVTGAIGGSMKGRHLDFMPRIAEARALVKRYKVNAMIDVSDGLMLDLWRVLEASRVGARICKGLIPLSKKAGPFGQAIAQGEDFELLFTMSPVTARRFLKTGRAGMKTPVALIGEVTDRKFGFTLLDEDGKAQNMEPKGYLHF